ncbi:hypothetical protein LfeInf_005 [Lactobacillus phage LfeInf]|uniref:Homing endonuclease n=1 Tax=Lactobacillus phage LfeInf TaxID=1567484 RepID=A0A0A7NNI1_9CAUD|nr:HNH endonuclease [Lactobacillus phage LfeInf]AIZ94631.1 hypothetical protein LfeInf_005 [Lactobacillus phage LfeInf]
MRRKTNDQFQQEVYDLVRDEYIFLDTYINKRTKIKVKHNKCGHIYKVRPGAFIRGSRCPYCSVKAKKTNAQFKQEVYALVGDEYTFLDKYVNDNTKIRVKHNKCGNIYGVRPTNFLRGTRCPYCAGIIKKTDKQFRQEVYALVGDEYTFLDKYVNAGTKIRVKHNKCGTEYKVTPINFLRGTRCPHCYGTPKKTNVQFRQEVYDIVGDDYTFLEPYVDSFTKLKVKHNKCGNIYEVRPIYFLSGNRCPYCNSPKGETVITKLLDTLNIDYEYQKTFPDLKYKSYLSYDFYIPSQSILIEYQGIQHYQPIDHFGGDDQFTIQQKHDQMKLDYAKSHGYNLIAVPYTEDTLYKIKKYLLKHGLADENTSVDTDTLHRLFDENKEVMDWLKDK